MKHTMLILVEPQHWDKNAEDWVGVTQDEAEMKKRWDEYKRLSVLLERMGLQKESRHNGSSMAFDCDGMAWEGKMTGDIFYITPNALNLLDGQAKQMAQLRADALKKLTAEEQHALGLLNT